MKEYKGINGKIIINDDGTLSWKYTIFPVNLLFKKKTFAISDISKLNFKESGAFIAGKISIESEKAEVDFEITFDGRTQNEFKELYALLCEKSNLIPNDF